MLIARTPFRISLGGGSTDLPSYSRKHGGFIFGVAINMYMDVFIRRPVIYDRIDLHYMKFESVTSPEKLEHAIAREALNMVGIKDSISIYIKSDTPMGTGLGSSGTCAVGLLNALWRFKGITKASRALAEEAFRITQNLGLPDGRQDPYLVALGGFTVMDIDTDDEVLLIRPNISKTTTECFVENSLLVYTGIKRESKKVLEDQNSEKSFRAKHAMKELGRKILLAFIGGNLDEFGKLMNEHWRLKKETSGRVSSLDLDLIYDLAMRNGCLGGKIVGAGGGGYFLFYCGNKDVKYATIAAMREAGYRDIPFDIDYRGTRVVDVSI